MNKYLLLALLSFSTTLCYADWRDRFDVYQDFKDAKLKSIVDGEIGQYSKNPSDWAIFLGGKSEKLDSIITIKYVKDGYENDYNEKFGYGALGLHVETNGEENPRLSLFVSLLDEEKAYVCGFDLKYVVSTKGYSCDFRPTLDTLYKIKYFKLEEREKK